jgi:hypothetical protein
VPATFALQCHAHSFADLEAGFGQERFQLRMKIHWHSQYHAEIFNTNATRWASDPAIPSQLVRRPASDLRQIQDFLRFGSEHAIRLDSSTHLKLF